MADMDKILIEKTDQVEQYLEDLREARTKIEDLTIENEGMSKDLDKAELLLEEYLDKINEQEQLIINLGEQCKEEKRIKESLFDQINENAVKSQLR